MKVLFVQEKPFLATALKLTLLNKGFELIISKNIHHPRSVIDAVNPEYIITDISKGDGIGYVDEAKKRNLPVIVISENGNEEYLQQAFDKGADDYVSLPLSHAELALRLRILVMQRQVAVA